MTVSGRDLVLREAELVLDRDGSRALHVQISDYMRQAILGKRLPAGSRLPSIRELAGALGIAPNTVARVYKDLAGEGLIESRPGRGSVVVPVASVPTRPGGRGTDFLRNILQPAASKAWALGYGWNDIARVLEESIVSAKARPGIALVAASAGDLTRYRDVLEEMLSDHDVHVNPVALRDLETGSEESVRALGASRFAVALPDAFGAARHHLERRGKRAVPLLTELSRESHEQLAQLPTEGAIALICNDARHGYIMWLLGLYSHPARVQWIRSAYGAQNLSVLESSAAVICDDGVSLEWIGEAASGKPVVVLEFVVSAQSWELIREMLLVAVGVGARGRGGAGLRAVEGRKGRAASHS